MSRFRRLLPLHACSVPFPPPNEDMWEEDERISSSWERANLNGIPAGPFHNGNVAPYGLLSVQTSVEPPAEKSADAVLRSEIARAADSKEFMIVSLLLGLAQVAKMRLTYFDHSRVGLVNLTCTTAS